MIDRKKLYDIFISYRREGGTFVGEKLYDNLIKEGYNAFFDSNSMASGRFDRQLLRVIEDCTDVILILPPNGLDRCTNEDDWVRIEISTALKMGKNIIPVMISSFEFPEYLPDVIKDIRYYNGVRINEGDSLDAVMDYLKKRGLRTPVPQKRNGKKTQNDDSTWFSIRRIPAIIVSIFYLTLGWSLPYIAEHYLFAADFIKRTCSFILKLGGRGWLVINIGIIIAFYYYSIDNDYFVARRKKSHKTIDLFELDLSPEIFLNNYIDKNGKMEDIEISSSTGEKVDYCLMKSLSEVSFFYLGGFTRSNNLVKMMMEQHFSFISENNKLYHFQKNDFDVYIKRSELFNLTVEICRKGSESQIKTVKKADKITVVMLDLKPEEFVEQYILICGGNEVTHKLKTTSNDRFSVIKELKGIRVASVDGKRVDFYSEMPDERSLFAVGSFPTRNKVISVLKEQGFKFVEKSGNIIHFENDVFDVYVKAEIWFMVDNIEVYRKTAVLM